MIGRNAKLAAIGYAITLSFLLALVVTSVAAVTRVREAEETAYRYALDNGTIERIRYLFEKKVATDRALLLAGRPEDREEVLQERLAFQKLIEEARTAPRMSAIQGQIEQIVALEVAHHAALEDATRDVETKPYDRATSSQFLNIVRPIRDSVDQHLDLAQALTLARASDAHDRALSVARQSIGVVITVGLALLIAASWLAFWMVRELARREDMEQRISAEFREQALETERALIDLRTQRDAALRTAHTTPGNSG